MTIIAEAGAGRVDPITLEVVRNKLDGIADEMEWTLLNSSFSPIVKEGMDASASLFTIDGVTLAQACAIPVHLTTLIPCVANILRVFTIDMYCMNDPYSGGTHIPDIAVIMPVFHDGQVVALSATMTHHQDMGGMAPGSVPTNATELFQEGIQIPALKLLDRGTYNDTLIQMLRLNVRMPDSFMGDLNAQIAACRVGAGRVRRLADTHGRPGLLALFAALLDRSEALTRAALRALPDGVYRSSDTLDNDGIDLDRRIPIEVAVTIAGDTIHFDFTGTSDQVRGPFNCVPSGAQAAAYYALRALTDPAIPTNGGCFRPVTLFLPEGSLVNPRRPAPVNARSVVIKLIANNLIGALAPAIPDRVTAFNANQHLIMFGGRRPDRTSYVVGEIVPGGTGAYATGDGVDVVESDATNGMNMPVEAMEMDFPLRLLRSELREGSGGDGRQRGGLGYVREYLALADGITLTHRGEHHYSNPRGIAGGGDGARARSVVTRQDGMQEVVPSKLMTVLNSGDRLLIQTGGGGGYGPAAGRTPEARRRDAADGKTIPTHSRGAS
jgi:N-methylhydantoinase B